MYNPSKPKTITIHAVYIQSDLLIWGGSDFHVFSYVLMWYSVYANGFQNDVILIETYFIVQQYINVKRNKENANIKIDHSI